MNSRIREIVRKHYDCACSATRSVSEALIKELEAYHDKAMVEAADGALVGRAALDRALGRDVSLDVLPGAQSPGDAVSSYVASVMDELKARAQAMGLNTESPEYRAAFNAKVNNLRAERRRMTTGALEAGGPTDIIERNARGWQEGESNAERARRLA